MRRFPRSRTKIHWVDDAAGLTFALQTIRSEGGVEAASKGGGVDRKRRTSTRGSSGSSVWTAVAAVVVLPVALVQAATRDAVFLIGL